MCECGRQAIGHCHDCSRPVCGWHSFDRDRALVCEIDAARRDAERDADSLASQDAVLTTVRQRLPELADRPRVHAEVYERKPKRFGKRETLQMRVLEGVYVLNGDMWSEHIDLLEPDGRVLVHRDATTVDVTLEEWLDSNGPNGVRRLEDLLKTLR